MKHLQRGDWSCSTISLATDREEDDGITTDKEHRHISLLDLRRLLAGLRVDFDLCVGLFTVSEYHVHVFIIGLEGRGEK